MEFECSYRFTEKAVQDFDEILRYMSVDLANPAAAQKLGKNIFEKIDIVRVFPDSGAPIENEFLSEKTVRKLLADNCIIYCKTHYEEKIISIVRIVYGKRNLDEILRDI
ncbi:MAG: type II toxin-antitoxin system RelE/ParE family toxin [Ruminococcaceae bacterium]|nr:type II toxin-antitoxin system RelE/ParE family toxin [Oscillospiraceae bacterium]